MPHKHLLPGEDLESFRKPSKFTANLTDNEINEKYLAGEVRIVTEQARYPLPSIPVMLETQNYNLNPEFQRRHRWSTEKRSRLIESFIMNVPVPPVFLYETEFSHYEVMDGLQRLTTINEFYGNSFALEGLSEWPELNGRRYLDLPIQIRNGIDRRYLSSVILLQETAKSQEEALLLKQLVFERINSGGEMLTPQESRNAIYNGSLNQLCIRLSRNEDLCELWGIPWKGGISPNEYDDELMSNSDYSTMNDVELVLRFFAYRQRNRKSSDRFRDFLDSYLKSGNALFSKDTLAEMKVLFEDTIKAAHEILGERAFWLYRKRNTSWSWLQRPTTSVYDPMMYILSTNKKSWPVFRSKSKSIKKEIEDFYQKQYQNFEGRNTNPSILTKREENYKEFFQRFL